MYEAVVWTITSQNVHRVMARVALTMCLLYHSRASLSNQDCRKSTRSLSTAVSGPPNLDNAKRLVTVTNQFSKSLNLGVPEYFLVLPLLGLMDCLKPSGNS